jgi:hypothetical protein
MRTTHFLLASVALVGCSWTEFDDLADTTWVRSTDEPNIGSRNYGIAILGVGTGAQGGQLGVISDDTPDYSTIDYGADGVDTVGASLKLGQHRIAALTDPPLFVTDGQGKIALAERSTTGGNIALVFGSATAPAGLEFAAPASPDAVTFAEGNVVVAAGTTLFTVSSAGSTPTPCASMDSAFSAAAIAWEGPNLWVWAKSGAFFSIPLTALTPCNGGMLPAMGNSLVTPIMPAIGARIHIVGSHAILTAHPPTSRMGQVFVVDIASLTPTQTDMLTVEGLRTSELSVIASGATTKTYLAVGVPERPVDNVIAGQVDVYEFDTATGTLSDAPVLQLNDAEPESGQLFGRSVTTMTFNGNRIFVVAANSEVFAYYKTALYDALP